MAVYRSRSWTYGLFSGGLGNALMNVFNGGLENSLWDGFSGGLENSL